MKNKLLIKAHNFLSKAGSAPISPFLPLIGKSLGFSLSMTGFAFTGISILRAFLKVLIRSFGFKWRKFIFLTFIVLQSISYFGIQYVPSIQKETSSHILCENETYVDICVPSEVDESYVDNFTRTYVDRNIFCKMVCPENDVFSQFLLSKNYSDFDLDDDFKILNGKNIVVKVSLDAESLFYVDRCLRLKSIWFTYRGHKWENASCDPKAVSNCDFHCGEVFYDIMNKKIENKDFLNYYQFWTFFSIVALATSASMVNSDISNSDDLDNQIWGSMGFGLFSVLSGFAVDKMSGENPNKDMTLSFYLSLAIMILNFFISTKIEKRTEMKKENSDFNEIVNFQNLAFTFWCVFVGFHVSIFENYLFWYLEDVGVENGTDPSLLKTLEGLLISISAYIGQIPTYIISKILFRKVKHDHLMTFILLIFGSKFLLYSIITSPWWGLAIAVLDGISSGLCGTTKTFYEENFIPERNKGKFKSFLSSHDILGISVGSSLGGYVMENYGGSTLFWYFGLSAFSCSFLNFAVHLIMKSPQQIKVQGEKDVNNFSEEDCDNKSIKL